MKKIVLLLLTSLLLFSCETFDDSHLKAEIESLNQRVTLLEELCKELNTNINSIQTILKALQENDYVTGVAPIEKAGEIVGYTISFTKSKPITIYHGKNGSDGKDGHSPAISVKKEADGLYYWTLDGEWLLDASGSKIKAQAVDGAPGIDGQTPELKIKDGKWFVRIGNGDWTELGQATGKDGDSFFKDVLIEESVITFVLINGETIKVSRHNDSDVDNNYIKYITTDNKSLALNMENVFSKFGAYLESNIFDKGEGILRFDGKIRFIGVEAFKDLKNLKTIILPSSVRGIECSAFQGCIGLESINIPAGVSHIGPSAFAQCSSLTEVDIPAGVSVISERAFQQCTSLKNMIIPDAVTTIGSSSFSGCSALAEVNIPTGLTDIQSSAFAGCSSLTGILLPEGLVSIGSSAFNQCSGLTEVDIPSGIAEIESCTFQDCSSLKKITIPDGIKVIGDYAFSGCSALTGIGIPTSVKSIGAFAFTSCNGLIEVNIPAGVTRIDYSTFAGCSSLKNIVIPEGVISIGSSAFSCSGLIEMTIPSSVTEIANEVFRDCTGLKKITIPDGVKAIGDYAFSGCSALTEAHIPAGITRLEAYVFSRCSALTSITIPEGVDYIGSCAFWGCQRLDTITIPESVSSIQSQVFDGCSNLQSIYCKALYPPTMKSMFETNPTTLKIYVPSTSIESYRKQSPWNKVLLVPYDYSTGQIVPDPEPLPSQSKFFSSIKWQLGDFSYDATSQYPVTAYFNGEKDPVSILKLGSSSRIGQAQLIIPPGTKEIGFYAFAWVSDNNVKVRFDVNGKITEIPLVPNEGFTAPSPHSIILDESSYFKLNVDGATTVKVSGIETKHRFALAGVKPVK